MGIETGVDLYKLIEAGQFMNGYLGKKNQSNTARAIINKGELLNKNLS